MTTDGEPGPVIGTYRVLTPAAAKRVGGLYSETEFDLTRLRAMRTRMAELTGAKGRGRQAQQPDSRGRSPGSGSGMDAFDKRRLSEVLGDSGKTKDRAADSWKTLVTSPKILLLFLFYALSSAANCGMVYFSVVAFTGVYAILPAVAATALTAYQVMSMMAVLPGGWLADRVKNTELLLCVCFLVSGALIVIAGLGVTPFWIAIGLVGAAGALRGLVNASRDVSVRHAATDVSVGTLFGFVTTGYSGGQILGPPLYGWLLDIGHPQLVFWGSAAFSTLAIATMATTTIWRPKAATA